MKKRKQEGFFEFRPNKELDDKKADIAKRYDSIFEQIRGAIKGSDKHFALLKKLNAVGKESIALITQNRLYFGKKRRHHFDNMSDRHEGDYDGEMEKQTKD